jgi:hypothetical protein
MWCSAHNFDYCNSCATTYELYHPHKLVMTSQTDKGLNYAKLLEFICNECNTSIKTEPNNYWCSLDNHDLCSKCASRLQTHYLI